MLSESLLPAIVELAEDKAWRVRQAIIEYIPLLATQLGKPFFDEQLGNLCMSWLGDSVYSIREAATVNLQKLTEVFGVEWARSAIVPKVMGMAQHPNYLYRLTTVQAITVRYPPVIVRSVRVGWALITAQTIAPSLTPQIIQAEVIEPLLVLAADPIPNIRFNVAKALEVLGTSFGTDASDLAETRLLPALDQQQKDGDADVRYFAGRAHQKVVAVAH
jgi:serine/threonine-protein phosphatase 2A regulatory subunit A